MRYTLFYRWEILHSFLTCSRFRSMHHRPQPFYHRMYPNHFVIELSIHNRNNFLGRRKYDFQRLKTTFIWLNHLIYRVEFLNLFLQLISTNSEWGHKSEIRHKQHQLYQKQHRDCIAKLNNHHIPSYRPGDKSDNDIDF